MKWQALKYKQDCSFLSPAKFRKIFSKINDIIKSSLLKWIICHTHLIQSPISNDHSIVNFDDLNGGVNTELHQKVLLQVYVLELHINMLKRDDTVFSMTCDKKRPFCISDYAHQILLLSKLWKIIQCHQIMCGCEICIQSGTDQESINNWLKCRLRYILKNEK